MTKLMEWLLGVSLIFSFWVAVYTGKVLNISENFAWFFKWFPVIFVFLFGVYAALVVLYRVFTFNNCESAAVELQKQIKEATTELQSKGIKLKRTVS